MSPNSMRVGFAVIGAAVACGGEPGSTPRLLGPGERVEPLRMAACQLAGSRLVRTGGWTEYAPTGARGVWRWAWDAFDGASPDPSVGVPTDDPPCTNQLPPGARWYFGETYHNPFTSNDIRFALPGVECQGVFASWFWGAQGAGTSEQCFIAILTFENWSGCAAPDPGSGPLDGVLYDLGILPSNVQNADVGFYHMGVDLHKSGLSHRMPCDGFGGYHVIFGREYDAENDRLVPATLSQAMLWGTGDNEIPVDSRVGSQHRYQFDDDFPPDGEFGPNECYEYFFGVCPDPLCSSVGFSLLSAGDPCVCTGDLSRDGVIELADLAVLLAAFGQTGNRIRNPCLDFDGNAAVDLEDVAFLLAQFGRPC